MTLPNPVTQTPKVSTQFIEWIFQTNRAIMGHLYLFTALDGTLDYFTDLDEDVFYLGQIWKSSSLRFEGLQRKIAIGTSVDEQTLKIWAAPTDTLFGANFLTNAEQGLMDGATVVRYRAIWAFNTGNAAFDVQNNTPAAVWPLFTGYIARIVKGGTSHLEFKVKSALHKLDTNMPRNYYQPGCLWTLFDAGCTLNKVSFQVNAAVGSAGLTSTNIPVSAGVQTPLIGPDSIATYSAGRLQFTSGPLNNLLILLAGNDANNLFLSYPLNTLPNPGDTFLYYPGCSKQFITCNLKFGNSANFRGFDKVPPVMVSL